MQKKTVFILADSAGIKTDAIMQGENFKLRYGLISNEILSKYNVKTNLSILIDINNPNSIERKLFFLEHTNNAIYKGYVHDGKVEFQDINAGSYYFRSLVANNYLREIKHSTIAEGNSEGILLTLENRNKWVSCKYVRN